LTSFAETGSFLLSYTVWKSSKNAENSDISSDEDSVERVAENEESNISSRTGVSSAGTFGVCALNNKALISMKCFLDFSLVQVLVFDEDNVNY